MAHMGDVQATAAGEARGVSDEDVYDLALVPEQHDIGTAPRPPLGPVAKRRRQDVNARLDRIGRKALNIAEEVIDGTHAQAEVPFKECSTQVRFAQKVYEQMMALRRGQVAAAVQLGVVTFQERMKDERRWEKMAQAIDVEAKETK